MVAGHGQHFMTLAPQPLEEFACILELVGSRPLGEIAGDDDQVGLQLVDPLFDTIDQLLVMGAEMKVGQMGDARHDVQTLVMLNLFQYPSW
jgi:hypothetical protein